MPEPLDLVAVLLVHENHGWDPVHHRCTEATAGDGNCLPYRLAAELATERGWFDGSVDALVRQQHHDRAAGAAETAKQKVRRVEACG
jgi:hypothetical protein